MVQRSSTIRARSVGGGRPASTVPAGPQARVSPQSPRRPGAASGFGSARISEALESNPGKEAVHAGHRWLGPRWRRERQRILGSRPPPSLARARHEVPAAGGRHAFSPFHLSIYLIESPFLNGDAIDAVGGPGAPDRGGAVDLGNAWTLESAGRGSAERPGPDPVGMWRKDLRPDVRPIGQRGGVAHSPRRGERETAWLCCGKRSRTGRTGGCSGRGRDATWPGAARRLPLACAGRCGPAGDRMHVGRHRLPEASAR